jgi:hypothetical protein
VWLCFTLPEISSKSLEEFLKIRHNKQATQTSTFPKDPVRKLQTSNKYFSSSVLIKVHGNVSETDRLFIVTYTRSTLYAGEEASRPTFRLVAAHSAANKTHH